MKIKIVSALVLFGLFYLSPAGADTVYPFNGNVDFEKKQFNFILDLNDNSSIKINFVGTTENKYNCRINLEHIKSRPWDFSSQIETNINVGNSQDDIFENEYDQRNSRFPKLHGKIWSQYTLVDYKPVRELNGDFEIINDRLYIKSFSFGQISLNGFIELITPFKIDFNIRLTAVDLDNFLTFWGPDKDFESGGKVNGEIKLSGVRDRLMMKGSLESVDGFIKKLHFDGLKLNLEGVYPRMQITKSFLSQTDGMTYSFQGPFNLGNPKTFKKQIRSLKMAPVIKDSSSEREWTIIRRKEESGKTEFKYRMQKGDSYGVSDTKQSDMLGVERTMEF